MPGERRRRRAHGGATRNRLGGALLSEGNVIAHNAGAGAAIRTGIGNLMRANATFGNGGLGIDLGAPGPTPNDPGDFDLGVNMQQNTPAITRVSGAGSVVQGTLSSTPYSTFTIDFYGSAACDPSGFGEGGAWLGSVSAGTDKKGIASFISAIAAAAPSASMATATDAADNVGSRPARRFPMGLSDDVGI
jgi:hypothetical protein